MVTALVTGASSGLGEEFAYGLARQGYELVLVARRVERLASVASKARALGAGETRVVVADLAAGDGLGEVERALSQARIEVGYLVNNAGFGTSGLFYELDLERELEQIDVNVKALVALTRLVLPGMVARGQGTIINVSSLSAFAPVPYMATYAATKAFVLSFSEAIASELRGTGVTVMALCPGPVRTEFQRVAGTESARIPSFVFVDAATVVAQALDGAWRGKTVQLNGSLGTLAAYSTRLAPRRLAAFVAGLSHRRRRRPAQQKPS
jgi:short-subunit dehydrogenase